MDTILGRRLGQYKIEAVLGAGSVGTVYRAADENLQRPCALKLIHPAIVRQPEMRQRIQQSIKAVSHLTHSGIVPLYDFGRIDGRVFLVSAFVPGRSLSHLWDELSRQQHALQLDHILYLAAQISDALAYAHQHNLTHQNLHPANILIKKLDRPPRSKEPPFQAALTDFGFTVLPSGGLQTAPLGDISRSLPYLAPEQCVGDVVDGRTDIYSLGIILYQMIAGQVPFAIRRPAEAIKYHMLEVPAPLRSLCPGLPAAVADIVAKAMAKPPNGRYSSATDLAADLRRVASRLTAADIQFFALQRTVVELTHFLPEPDAQKRVPPASESPENGRSRPVPASSSPQPALSGFAAPLLPGQTASSLNLNARTVKMPLPAAAKSAGNSPDSKPPVYGRLTIAQEGRTPRQITLSQSRLQIGRQTENDIVLSDLAVSRHHAELRRKHGRWQVQDLGSHGGTFMDGRQLAARQAVDWLPGQTVQIGPYNLSWSDGGASSQRKPHEESGFLRPGPAIIPELTARPAKRLDAADAGQITCDKANENQAPARPPRSRFSLTVWPHTLPGEGVCHILLQNEGDLEEKYTLVLRDETGQLQISQPESVITLKPGESQMIYRRIRPRLQPWVGRTQLYPYVVEVRSHSGMIQRDTAVLQVRPFLSVAQFWLLLFALLFLLAASGAALLWVLGYSG